MTFMIQDIRQLFQLTPVDEQKKMLLMADNADELVANWQQQGVDVTLFSPAKQALSELPETDYSYQLLLAPYALATAASADDVEQTLFRLARAAEEVRVFPLDNPDLDSATWVAPTLVALQAKNYGVELKDIADYDTHHAMLRIWANECEVE